MISKDAIRDDETAAYEQMIGRHQQCATYRLMPSFNTKRTSQHPRG
jgi:hypothetical protein